MRDNEKLLECAKEFQQVIEKALERNEKHIDFLNREIDHLEKIVSQLTKENEIQNGNN